MKTRTKCGQVGGLAVDAARMGLNECRMRRERDVERREARKEGERKEGGEGRGYEVWRTGVLISNELFQMSHLRSLASAGEGTHATFAPRGWKQIALQAYVTNKLGHCEIEQVGGGDGRVGVWRRRRRGAPGRHEKWFFRVGDACRWLALEPFPSSPLCCDDSTLAVLRWPVGAAWHSSTSSS